MTLYVMLVFKILFIALFSHACLLFSAIEFCIVIIHTMLLCTLFVFGLLIHSLFISVIVFVLYCCLFLFVKKKKRLEK